MRSLKFFSFVFIFLSFSSLSASIHLPQQDKNLYRQVEKLMVLSSGSSVVKPYSLNYVLQQLESIKHSQPAFHRQLSSLLKPYQRALDLNGSLSVSLADDSELEMVKPNSLGNRNQSNGDLLVATQFQFSDWFVASGGLSALNSFEDSELYNTYVSVGFDSIQLDVGYRSFWMSPFQSRAMLNSNNAKQTLSVSLFNPVPFDFANIIYEVFIREMEKQNNVLANGERVMGRPYILGTHLSFEPFDGVTIGLNRTFQFGGRGSSISASDVWNAFTDAVGSDNGTLIENCAQDIISQQNCEFGNQRAAVTFKVNFTQDLPFSVYGEYAGEDAASGNNLFLGNLAVSMGIFFPEIKMFGESMSFVYEVTEYQNAWHGHHIYREGYRIDGVSSGHWGTNYVSGSEVTAGLSQYLKVDLEQEQNLFEAELYYHQNRLAPGQSAFPVDYADVYNLSIKYTDLNHPDWRYKVEVGQNYLGESTWAGSVQWGF